MQKYVLGPHAARELLKLIRGSGEVSRIDNLGSGVIDGRDFALPYEVQWAQSVASGAGSWIIWLPSSDLVNVNGDDYDPTGSVTAAGGNYPSGWYQLSASQLNRNTGGKLYLNIVKSSSAGGGYELSFSTTATTAEESFAVPICVASVNSTTGERKVKQIAASVIVIGGSGEGGGADPDNVSLDKAAAGNTKLEIFQFLTKAAEAQSLAESLVASYLSDNREYIERNGSGNARTLKYRGLGGFVKGNYTNLVFTSQGNGKVGIDVYYS